MYSRVNNFLFKKNEAANWFLTPTTFLLKLRERICLRGISVPVGEQTSPPGAHLPLIWISHHKSWKVMGLRSASRIICNYFLGNASADWFPKKVISYILDSDWRPVIKTKGNIQLSVTKFPKNAIILICKNVSINQMSTWRFRDFRNLVTI